MQSRKLILMRHAKADYPLGVSDHERPLASRGHREAPAAGAWLVENNLVPDYILCSDALRARSTCAWVLSELGEKGPTPYVDSRIYGAGVAKLCSIINEVPDTVSTLLVIGHQPVLQDLALRLASVDSDEVAEWLDRVEAGNLYVNRGITGAIVQRQSFGGWKRSGFGDLNQHGPDSIRFYTKTKTVTSRWPSGVKDGAEFSIPTMN